MQSSKRRFTNRWHRLPISRQLLLLVNLILIGLVVFFLGVDYRLRMQRHLHEKQVALTEEAKSMYESLLVIQSGGRTAIQDLVDNVCARMNTTDSPGHHIAVDWQGHQYQARSHGHDSHEMMSAMQNATHQETPAERGALPIVVGYFSGAPGTVYISEKRSTVIDAARQSLWVQTMAVLMMGAIAAIVVSLVLRQLIARPVQELARSLKRVATGDLSVIASTRSCKELSFLADQINSMTMSLDIAKREHRFQMTKARQIQHHLLPKQKTFADFEVAQLFTPAEDVGGDYFDVISLSDEQQLICLADVTGHGIPAAMAATVIKSLVIEAAALSHCPGEILTRINRRYSEIILPGHLATMVVLVMDTRSGLLTYANAGHESPFLQKPTGEILRLTEGDFVLGVDEDVSYQATSVTVPSGTKFILVSDGVTEMFDVDEEQFGIDRVTGILNATILDPVSVVVSEFDKELKRFRGAQVPFDDTTLLVAQFTGGR